MRQAQLIDSTCRAGEGSSLEGLSAFKLKKINAFQAEAYKDELYFSKAEQTKMRKAKQRHVQLKILSGSAAGTLLRLAQAGISPISELDAMAPGFLR